MIKDPDKKFSSRDYHVIYRNQHACYQAPDGGGC